MSGRASVMRGTGRARALWYTAPSSCAIGAATYEDPQSGEAMVQTLYSGISRGTEGLVYRGEVPQSEWQRMRAPFQEGDFPHPVKYGYANVGKVLDGGGSLSGRTVFSLFPHQDVFNLPSEALVPIPKDVSPERAVLAANMETALNALWDGKPSPGDHICVVGGGVVGLLTAYVAGRLPGSKVTLVDVNPARAEIAEALGLAFALPQDAPRGQDLVFHASATAPGLATALACAGDGTAVVEMSWYGANAPEVPLGADFHCRRLRLVSSQVGTIPVDRQARWTYRRRMETALTLLADPVLDRLISHRIEFQDLPETLPAILEKSSDVLTALVVYDTAA
ncbi:zinc-binding alcohol dehydrogenase [Rhodobacterales bacterium]|nr:zinc-binding alcohol dehydrogenase [Rhodobacterales bacterium]